MTPHKSATDAWADILSTITRRGEIVKPRGIKTREVPHLAVSFDMRHPVVTCPPRKLSYKFLAAEALWITSGDDRVETIVRYNRNIQQFSDDGKTFFGAYGPRFCEQINHVVDTLAKDPVSRQAVISLWRPNPPGSRDIPCTLNLIFTTRPVFEDDDPTLPSRERYVHTHVFMRSSDAWLGVPYDFFNFTMMTCAVACKLGLKTGFGLRPGRLYWTAASSHLYETNNAGAEACLDHLSSHTYLGPELPRWAFHNWETLHTSLVACRDNEIHRDGRWKIRPNDVDVMGTDKNDEFVK